MVRLTYSWCSRAAGPVGGAVPQAVLKEVEDRAVIFSKKVSSRLGWTSVNQQGWSQGLLSFQPQWQVVGL
jgi:hypothetical protein